MKKNYFNKIMLGIFAIIISFSLSSVMADEISNDAVVTSLDDEINAIDLDTTAQVSDEPDLIDSQAQDGVYKFSEHKLPYLPFVRFCNNKIIVDSDINNSGVCFSQRSIEIENKMSKAQVLFAGDTVRINEQMEFALIFAGSNTIIDSTINGDALIFAQDTVTITKNARINGDIIIYATNIVVEGDITGSVIGVCNEANVSGKVENDLRLETQKVTLSDDSIQGNVYISTTNQDLKLSDNYADATIKYVKNEVKETFNLKNILLSGIITSLVFAILYIVISKATKDNLYENTMNKLKNNYSFAVMFGCLFIILVPIAITFLILLSILGLYCIAIPVMILLFAYLLVVGLLSTFIVGSTMAYYMSEKYFKDQGTFLKALATFIIYLVLYIFARLPKIGGYITIILVIVALGIVATMLFKKVIKNEEKDKVENVEKENKD